MAWPTPNDYHAAIQNPTHCFCDPELCYGEAAADEFGLPLLWAGSFAAVFQVRCPLDRVWAVKCFTRPVPDRRERYQAISQHLQGQRSPFMVEFRYLEEGIRVHGHWYPIVKMRWVEGRTLTDFVAAHAGDPGVLGRLAQTWATLAEQLRRADLAHGDLHPGNVLLAEGAAGDLRLLDYDGMWVPALAGNPPDEIGAPNYQHPARGKDDHSRDIDRFSHLLVYTALRCLEAGGQALWDRHFQDDNLLFRKDDFDDPASSLLLRELLALPHPAATLVGHLLLAARGPVRDVPLLSGLLAGDTVVPLSAEQRARIAALVPGARVALPLAPGAPRLATRSWVASPWPVALAVLLALGGAGGLVWAVATRDRGGVSRSALAIARWVERLGDSDPGGRRKAADELGRLGPEAAGALPALLRRLGDEERAVGAAAAAALDRIDPGWARSPAARQAIPVLIDRLSADSAVAQQSAAEALAWLGREAAPAAPALVKLLAESDPDLRGAAMRALARIGPPAVPALLARLTGGDEDARNMAAQTLGMMGPFAHPAERELVLRLADQSAVVRAAAAAALERIDPYWSGSRAADEAVHLLTLRLCDADLLVRKSARETLEKISTVWSRSAGARQAVPDLLGYLAPGGPAEGALAAMEVLGQIGPDARPAVPALVARLADASPLMRGAARQALDKIDSLWGRSDGARQAIPRLTALLGDPDADLRIVAADALGQVGPRGAPATPALIRLLADSKPEVREAAADALRKIDEDWLRSTAVAAALPAVVKRLADADDNGRKAAADLLGQIGPAAAPAVPLLIVCQADGSAPVRAAAANTLEKIDKLWIESAAARKAVPELVKLLARGSAPSRAAAADVLAKMGRDAASAVPDLVRLLADSDAWVRQSALRALGKVGPRAVPELAKVVAGGDESSRKAAAELLGQIGPGASAGLGELVQRLADDSPAVREASAEALAKIDPRWARSAEAREAVPGLIGMLRSTDRTTRQIGAEALGRIGPAAADAIPELTRRRFDVARSVAQAATLALRQIDQGRD
jgi:HEAT repeat protein